MMITKDIIGLLIGYFLGSIPSAWVIVKLFFRKDLRREGSRNIGATNSYEVTGKKWVGAAVYVSDALKGALAVWVTRFFFPWDFEPAAVAAAAAVLGHNFSFILKFRGGRGLATASGALLAISPFAVIIWAVLWAMEYYIIHRQVHIANVFATLLTPLLAIFAPDPAIMDIRTLEFWFADDYRILLGAICFIILTKHIFPIIGIIKKKG